MADYRLFFLGSDGAIEARHDFAAPDDETALQIMTMIGQASADANHGVMLWQGTRRIFELLDTEKSGGALAATSPGVEIPQRVLDCAEALLASHWPLAKSQQLRQAAATWRRALSPPKTKN
jgi:hypothetical protein